MSNIKINPGLLNGEVTVPPSKSVAHRALFCAALAGGISIVKNVSMSDDIKVTMNCLNNIGAKITYKDNTAYVNGIDTAVSSAVIDCNESGSTLRFIIPVLSAFGITATINGSGKLPSRPITPYINEMSKKGVSFKYNNTMPFSLSGQLANGEYHIPGDISSQFITGLLFALPLLKGDSKIIITTEFESKPYVDLTVHCMSQFGVDIKETEYGYFIKGNQKYKPCDYTVEGDYSQSAFFYVANFLGSKININGLKENSKQGDKKIVEIIDKLGYNNNENFDISAKDIPDIVPILCVLGAFCKGTSYVRHAKRLRIKECDRLQAMSDCINRLGGDIKVVDDTVIINGGKLLHGGVVDSYNDHRIAMSMAICATVCSESVVILNSSSVRKSYPDFFEVFKLLGGKTNVVSVE